MVMETPLDWDITPCGALQVETFRFCFTLAAFLDRKKREDNIELPQRLCLICLKNSMFYFSKDVINTEGTRKYRNTSNSNEKSGNRFKNSLAWPYRNIIS